MLTDTGPDVENPQDLHLWDWAEERKVILGRFLSPPPFRGEIRRDLHPRWSRDGRQVCFDSVHDICTDPAPSRHVLPVLCESEHITAIDNWQGPDVFLDEGAPAWFQDRIAVITDVDLGTPEQMDRFMDWELVRSVPLGFYAVDHDTVERVLGRPTLVRNKVEIQIA